MNKLADRVLNDLATAIENDDLVLPTLPEVALDIREAAQDSDITALRLSKVIGRDMALAARLIKVVNSPLLRRSQEVTELQGAISRLGTQYTCNLAIGLVIEQIFHARSPAVATWMRQVWAASQQIAGFSYEICRRHSTLAPDQAALAGLVHQIGMLPILAYAEDRNELLSDAICLAYVIDILHPMLGDKILAKWDFPPQLANVPSQCLDPERQGAALDYADVVRLAGLIAQPANTPLDALSASPALLRLDAPPSAGVFMSELRQLPSLFG